MSNLWVIPDLPVERLQPCQCSNNVNVGWYRIAVGRGVVTWPETTPYQAWKEPAINVSMHSMHMCQSHPPVQLHATPTPSLGSSE